jgi:probable F420-dependent oxidoreductase
LSAAARGAEERGFDSLWVAEHVVLFDEYESPYPYSPDGKIPGVAADQIGILEPLSTLCFLAAETERIRLGTGVCLVPQRNPVYTAKEVANVDWLSDGRIDFGIGVGWLAEEFKVCGVPFERRGARCDSYLQAMKNLWCEEVSEYCDEFYEIPKTRFLPKPVQQPHPPIHVGGESRVALRRVARHAQGWFGFNVSPQETVTHLETLDQLLAAEGRSRSEIQITIGPYSHNVGEKELEGYKAAGVDQVVVMAMAAKLSEFNAVADDLVRDIVEPAHKL